MKKSKIIINTLAAFGMSAFLVGCFNGLESEMNRLGKIQAELCDKNGCSTESKQHHVHAVRMDLKRRAQIHAQERPDDLGVSLWNDMGRGRHEWSASAPEISNGVSRKDVKKAVRSRENHIKTRQHPESIESIQARRIAEAKAREQARIERNIAEAKIRQARIDSLIVNSPWLKEGYTQNQVLRIHDMLDIPNYFRRNDTKNMIRQHRAEHGMPAADFNNLEPIEFKVDSMRLVRDARQEDMRQARIIQEQLSRKLTDANSRNARYTDRKFCENPSACASKKRSKFLSDLTQIRDESGRKARKSFFDSTRKVAFEKHMQQINRGTHHCQSR